MKARTAGVVGGTVLVSLALAVAAASGVPPFPGTAAPAGGPPSPTTSAASYDGVTLRPVDGGAGYYAQFRDGLPPDPSFFPIAVWFESVLDKGNIALDKEAGLNTYVELTANSDLQLVKASGMYAIPTFDSADASGFALSDEVDMWAGPGSAPWTGKYPGEGPLCVPEDSKCGYTVQKERRAAAPRGAMLYANYGKGVAFWLSDEESVEFFKGIQDLVSADTYWFTDPSICAKGEGGAIVKYTRDLTPAECRLAANYGWTIERIRTLQAAGNRTPIWAFVEAGHPFKDSPDATTITAPQIRAAVWSSLIHGARGVIYFNHNFGGDCISQHVLRDCGVAVRPTVTALNRQITDLAPVLNGPFLDGATAATGPVDFTTKLHDGKVYIFAGANSNAGGQAGFHIQCGGSTAVVIDENRSIPVVNGTFTDTFADGNAVHLYRIDGGGSCGF
ncbi:hypothetical protein J2Y66_001747 [Paenarthrobacter nitroguajacolicus]|uniref:hypothetical protein n=1 Tax=Paenarthrobacter TaxID=1742992 RepID=UPI002856CD01|nr:hypothetical protein [Paenarthrobacter nitroguajacolicus]MDR6987265.1 hypothetical protein [Paenarthrobacter nitroguajacolicus]